MSDPHLRDGIVIKEIRSKRDLADYFTAFREDDALARLGGYLDITESGRAAAFDFQNFACKSRTAVLAEMKREQRRPARKGCRSAYHFVVSARGRTDPATMIAMGRRLLRLADLHQQRAIFAVHDDTANTHLHIAVAALDEEGRQIILERGYSHTLLEHANAQLCFEFGRAPEAGLGFYATAEGVFRTGDDHRVRDANFAKVSRDFRRLGPARTPMTKRVEAETGQESLQSIASRVFDAAYVSEFDISSLIAMLAVQGIDYQLTGSGATISIKGVTFKASQISSKATPTKLAKRFRLVHLTATKAQAAGLGDEPGFFKADRDGALTRQYQYSRRFPEDAPAPQDLPGTAAKAARVRAQQEKADRKAFPDLQPAHLRPLLRRINLERKRATTTNARDSDQDAGWRLARLEEARRQMLGKTGGRPSRRHNGDDHWQPPVKANSTAGVVLYHRRASDWWIKTWQAGDRVVQHGSIKTVYRGQQIVATLGADLVTLHTNRPQDHRAALLQAYKQFGPDLRIYGSAKFRRQLTKIAIKEGIVLANPELAAYQKWLLQPVHAALSALARRLEPAVDAALATAQRKLQHLSAATQSAVHEALAADRDRLAGSGARLSDIGRALDVQKKMREAEERQAAEARARAAEELRRVVAEKAELRRRQQQAQEAANAKAVLDRARIEGRRAREDAANKRQLSIKAQEQFEATAARLRAADKSGQTAPPIAPAAVPQRAQAQTPIANRTEGADPAAHRLPQPTVSASAPAPHSQPVPHPPIEAAARAPVDKPGAPSAFAPDPATAAPGASVQAPDNSIAQEGVPATQFAAPQDRVPVVDTQIAAERERAARLDAALEMLNRREGGALIKDQTLHGWDFEQGNLPPISLRAGEVLYAQRMCDEAAEWLDNIARAFWLGNLRADGQGKVLVADATEQSMAADAERIWTNPILRDILERAGRGGEMHRASALRARENAPAPQVGLSERSAPTAGTAEPAANPAPSQIPAPRRHQFPPAFDPGFGR